MPTRYEISRVAPETSTQLAAYEGRGMGAFGYEALQVPQTQKIPTTSEQAQAQDPNTWTKIANFFQSETFQNATGTALNAYQAREARKIAEQSAANAEEKARLESLLIEEQRKAARIARRQQTAPAPQSGIPTWVWPVAIGGGTLILLLAIRGRQS